MVERENLIKNKIVTRGVKEIKSITVLEINNHIRANQNALMIHSKETICQEEIMIIIIQTTE